VDDVIAGAREQARCGVMTLRIATRRRLRLKMRGDATSVGMRDTSFSIVVMSSSIEARTAEGKKGVGERVEDAVGGGGGTTNCSSARGGRGRCADRHQLVAEPRRGG